MHYGKIGINATLLHLVRLALRSKPFLSLKTQFHTLARKSLKWFTLRLLQLKRFHWEIGSHAAIKDNLQVTWKDLPCEFINKHSLLNNHGITLQHKTHIMRYFWTKEASDGANLKYVMLLIPRTANFINYFEDLILLNAHLYADFKSNIRRSWYDSKTESGFFRLHALPLSHLSYRVPVRTATHHALTPYRTRALSLSSPLCVHRSHWWLRYACDMRRECSHNGNSFKYKYGR